MKGSLKIMSYINDEMVDNFVSSSIRKIASMESLLGVVDKLLLDDMLYAHSVRVSKLSTQLALVLNLPSDMVYKVCIAGFLHDLGKINTPAEILYKAGRLTSDEFEIVKKHPVDGFNLLEQAGVDEEICYMVLKHHVKEDGQGYPLGFESKTLAENIITVADIFSALIERRTYHLALDYCEALETINSFDGLNENILAALNKIFGS